MLFAKRVINAPLRVVAPGVVRSMTKTFGCYNFIITVLDSHEDCLAYLRRSRFGLRVILLVAISFIEISFGVVAIQM
jgi:hypothetical protein